MRNRLLSVVALACSMWFGLAVGPEAGQAPAAGPSGAARYVAPKTPWGDPDIQGGYSNKDENGVPFERPGTLAGKQLGAFDKQERISVFRAVEDVLAENMYDIASVSSTLTWFADGSLRNTQMPREAYNGATPYMKYWWFDKA